MLGTSAFIITRWLEKIELESSEGPTVLPVHISNSHANTSKVTLYRFYTNKQEFPFPKPFMKTEVFKMVHSITPCKIF